MELARRLKYGLIACACLVGAVLGWGSFARLSGAVVSSGMVVIESSSKKIQHPVGGVVGRIVVKNGTRVAAGDVLVTLDDTQTRASLGIVNSQLTELLGRKARLAAERDDLDEPVFPSELLQLGGEAGRVVAGELKLFQTRRITLDGQKAQIGERIKQIEDETRGLLLQSNAKQRELTLVRAESARVNDLFKRNLLPVTRALNVQRDETRIEGESGTLMAQIAKLGGQIAESRLQILSLDQNRYADAQKELRDIEGKIAELRERRIAAEDQLQRVEIRSPIDGTVHELSVHTQGGVIGPAEQLMLIVPSGELLTIEARIPSSEIDQVVVGRPVVLRFTAFNQRTTPEVKGQITRVSADAVRDQQSGQTFYTVRVTPDPADMGNLGEHKIIPGMPVEVFIETGERSALSYLTKPITDQFHRAFREH